MVSEVAPQGGMFGLEGGGSSSGIVTYPVDITLNDPDPRLKIGMTAHVSLALERRENVKMVPLTSVFNDGENEYVNKVTYDENGISEYEQVPVTVISSNESVSVIEGDIQEGDLVEYSSSSASNIFGMM